MDVVDILLAQDSIDVNAINSHGETPLNAAVIGAVNEASGVSTANYGATPIGKNEEYEDIVVLLAERQKQEIIKLLKNDQLQEAATVCMILYECISRLSTLPKCKHKLLNIAKALIEQGVLDRLELSTNDDAPFSIIFQAAVSMAGYGETMPLRLIMKRKINTLSNPIDADEKQATISAASSSAASGVEMDVEATTVTGVDKQKYISWLIHVFKGDRYVINDLIALCEVTASLLKDGALSTEVLTSAITEGTDEGTTALYWAAFYCMRALDEAQDYPDDEEVSRILLARKVILLELMKQLSKSKEGGLRGVAEVGPDKGFSWLMFVLTHKDIEILNLVKELLSNKLPLEILTSVVASEEDRGYTALRYALDQFEAACDEGNDNSRDVLLEILGPIK